MIPVSRILCATDFSDPSYKGLTAAVELGRQFSAEVTLIHVISPMPVAPLSHEFSTVTTEVKAYLDQVEKSAKEELNRLITKHGSTDLQMTGVVRSGEAAEEIANYAKAGGSDLIVISTHGHSGWKRLVTGSVAEKVVRLAECAVLTVHRNNDEQ
jgi:nucleotide-binding universal stress UspA family protein